MTVGGM